MNNPQIAVMIIFLALGGIANQVQTMHLRKPFLSPLQFKLVSFFGFFCFLAGAFTAFKGIFPSF